MQVLDHKTTFKTYVWLIEGDKLVREESKNIFQELYAL